MMALWRQRQAISAVRRGEVIAYPTEAVFGLGCDPWDADAVFEILRLKQRPWEKGLILIASELNQLNDFIKPLPAKALAQLEQSWPGPVTWLLPASERAPDYLIGNHETIAVRVTGHPIAARLCRQLGHALVSTSANRAGMRPAREVRHVRWQLPELKTIVTGRCGLALRPSQIRDIKTGAIIR